MRLLILFISFLISQVAEGQILNASAPYRVRAVVSVCSDADAQGFIDSSGITDQTQKDAICTLVQELKDSSLWTSMLAIYPFVGGTASTHKWNLKDPQNTDAAFRLSFSGTWTHSSNGADPNGTDAYANTFYAPSSNAGATSRHISFYSREDVQTGRDMGASAVNFVGDLLHIEYSDGNCYGQIGTLAAGGTAGNSAAFFVGSRIDNTDSRIYKTGTLLITNVGANSYNPSEAVYIGNINQGGSLGTLYSNRQVAFASMGDGFTADQVRALNTIVEKYQDALGRGVQ